MSHRETVDAALALIRLLRGVDDETGAACLEVLVRLGSASPTLTMHELGLVLDEIESGAFDEEVWEVLISSGTCIVVGSTLELAPNHVLAAAPGCGARNVTVQEVLRLLDSSAPDLPVRSTTAADLTTCVERVVAWARTLLRYAQDEELSGFPVFWQREDGGNNPLGRNVGSMAATDTLVLALEPVRFGWPVTTTEADRVTMHRAWRQLIALGIDDPGGWYDGAISFPEFDDDFVGAFLPEQGHRGSCPTTEAIANRVSGLIVAVRAFPDVDARLVECSFAAIIAGVDCLVRWQDSSGAWANHKYPEGGPSDLPLRDVSSQYAVEALTDALVYDLLPPLSAKSARRALVAFADFLCARVHILDGRAHWLGDFAVDDESHALRTTTLIGLVIGKAGAALEDDRLQNLQALMVRYLAEAWEPRVNGVFESEFRSPTWDGPALGAFTWDMVRDAFVVASVLDFEARSGPLDHDLAARLQQAIDGILRSEYHGSWLDVPMAKEGRNRAFVSNSLHTLRAVLAAAAWTRRALPDGIGPGW